MASQADQDSVGSFTSGIDSIPDKPYHPQIGYKFPKRTFGKTKPVERSCHSEWFAKWQFLHYNESLDAVFCHICVMAKKMKKGYIDPAFVSFVLCMSEFYLIINCLGSLDNYYLLCMYNSGYPWFQQLERRN